ncbi:MAG TPA: AAA family ATPase, partial [Cystobacter sp.]
MYINRLHVKNLKRMRDLALDFTHEGKPRMWTVLVAENGACKTTLLQAIALVASGSARANQLADVPSLPDLRRPASEAARILADFEFGTRLEKWRLFPAGPKITFGDQRAFGLRSSLGIEPEQSIFLGESWFASVDALASSVEELPIDDEEIGAIIKDLQSRIKTERVIDRIFNLKLALEGSDATLFSRIFSRALGRQDPVSEARSKSFPGWFVAGYGTQRQLPVPLSVSDLKDQVLNRLEPLFGKAPLVGTGFANQFADTPRFEPFIQALKKVFVDNHLLPHVDAVELRGRGGVTQPGDLVRSHSFEFEFSGQKTKVPATWLSQGYQSTIAWIADLIGQMYLDIGEAIPLEDMEGMVLIDELDLHLHPTWQVRLV